MIINLISGPRNISTALMYSFAQRQDVKVIDEPFYAHYLFNTKAKHPGAQDVLDTMENNYKEVIAHIRKLEMSYEHIFIKNMAHHLDNIDESFLNTYVNIFLIRDPKQLIASFAKVIPRPSMQDIGLKREFELFEYISKYSRIKPIVIDSNMILENPKKGLRSLCNLIGIEPNKSMLTWEKGPIPEDGIWAKYWYENVHNSTGFLTQKTSSRELPKHCEQLYSEALPYFEKMKLHT